MHVALACRKQIGDGRLLAQGPVGDCFRRVRAHVPVWLPENLLEAIDIPPRPAPVLKPLFRPHRRFEGTLEQVAHEGLHLAPAIEGNVPDDPMRNPFVDEALLDERRLCVLADKNGHLPRGPSILKAGLDGLDDLLRGRALGADETRPAAEAPREINMLLSLAFFFCNNGIRKRGLLRPGSSVFFSTVLLPEVPKKRRVGPPPLADALVCPLSPCSCGVHRRGAAQ